ncbi:MAG: hypothetical protein U0531_16995 [Dehalococcoidia bacterium]
MARTKQTTPEDLWLDINGLRLHLMRWPGAGLPLLLLHGSAGQAALWEGIAAAPAVRHPALALDLRGALFALDHHPPATGSRTRA